jgi:2-keto-4-pentenoate hydratase/2-oxohepta-3-ene-1,7-dioic acid hydratase in catechol pathway
MHLATLAINGSPRAAVRLDDGSVLDIAAASDKLTGTAADALRSGSLQAVIACGQPALDAIAGLIEQAKADNGVPESARIAASDARFLAPLPSPSKNVFCVGRNYSEHIAEGDRAQKQKVGVTEHPVYFTKPPTAVIGHRADIPLFPEVSESIDYEVELAVVIGTPGRNIAKAAAMKHIFGYTIINDITARDIQRRHGGQYFKGKALDGSCPTGPWLVTADTIADPHALSIRLSVNGESRQDGNTNAMIFDIPTLIASLSEGLTLESGDMIATGTPSGVGYAMEPPRFLGDGDTVVCEVENIGRLENTVRRVGTST